MGVKISHLKVGLLVLFFCRDYQYPCKLKFKREIVSSISKVILQLNAPSLHSTSNLGKLRPLPARVYLVGE